MNYKEVKGLVSAGDVAAITALVAAVQHDTKDRYLDSGFQRILVPF